MSDLRGPILKKISSLYYGWIMVFLAVIGLAVLGIQVYSFGIFMKPVTRELQVTRGALALAMTLPGLFGGIFQIFAGRLADKYGPRYLYRVHSDVAGPGPLGDIPYQPPPYADRQCLRLPAHGIESIPVVRTPVSGHGYRDRSGRLHHWRHHRSGDDPILYILLWLAPGLFFYGVDIHRHPGNHFSIYETYAPEDGFAAFGGGGGSGYGIPPAYHR
jgi:hypothetical protein